LLILTLKTNEGIIIGGGIRVMVVEIRGKQVRLGIEAPSGIEVLRDKISTDKAKKVDIPKR
jgi:carbon storage regulator